MIGKYIPTYQIFCVHETDSCKNSKIKEVHNMIVGNGDGSLCGSIITRSNFDDNRILYVFISDTNSGTSFDIYCTVSDT